MAAHLRFQRMGCRNVATADTLESLLNVGRDMLPKNIIKASAESSYLGIMVAACAALPVCITSAVVLCTPGTASCPCGWGQYLAMGWMPYILAASLLEWKCCSSVDGCHHAKTGSSGIMQG